MQQRASYYKTLMLGIIILGFSAGVTVRATTVGDPTIPSASDVAVATSYETPITITLAGTSNDSGSITFSTSTSPAHGALGSISGSSVEYTPALGYSGTDTFQFLATEGATSSAPATVTITVSAPVPTTGTAQMVVRSGSTIATSSLVSFPLAGTTSIAATLGTSHEVAASSTLAALSALDALAVDFDITDLQYNSLYGAFYLRCITLAATSTPDCDNWQYTVNGTGPAVGMDKQILHDGDVVYVYFGYPRIVELSASTVPAGTAVTATATQYDPVNGVYVPVSGYTLGATQPNPADPWNPLEIATSSVNASGQALFTLSATGTYAMGIKEDYYFPTTPLTVTEAPPSSGGSSGGAAGSTVPTAFDVPKALAFLASQQKPDGSFTSLMLTDWSAIALSAYPSAARDLVRLYLSTPKTLASITDYERHAMALQSLGINPYNGAGTDVIAPIVAAFDGTQIGDASLVTDDIFALFPLLHAGYIQEDALVRSIAAFIISKQKPDGSWESSVDVTAAAVQALGPLYTVPGYGPALGRASGYIASKQQSDGGWGNVDSTSWVMTMINAMNEADPSRARSWTTASGKTPKDALAAAQASDGAARPIADPAGTDSRTWSTAYAIVAASGKSWVSLLQNVSKPATPGAGGSIISSATSTATSTPATASTTPLVLGIATSTEEISGAATITESAGTTTATTTPKAKPAPPKKTPKKPAPKSAAPVAETPTQEGQAASAATAAPADSLLGRFWSWLQRLFGR